METNSLNCTHQRGHFPTSGRNPYGHGYGYGSSDDERSIASSRSGTSHGSPPNGPSDGGLGGHNHCYHSSTRLYSIRGPFTRKPLSLIQEQESYMDSHPHSDLSNGGGSDWDSNDGDNHMASSQTRNAPKRHLSLFDLLSVGVGGTVGSGIFVLTGAIAHGYAGPATCVSFAISGVAAAFSGLCYAELAGKLPVAGSTYSYAYATLGEWAAVVAAACLTLEYGVSGAAVARSWGDKVVEYLSVELQWDHAAKYLLPTQSNDGDSEPMFNPMAGIVSILCTVLLAYGIQESKTVSNAVTVFKMAIVAFMTFGGFVLFKSENLSPFAPFGVTGIVRGATSSFFGYIGFDEVCCLAGEAKNPQRDLPRAVLGTLACVTIFYILASLALVGMLPAEDISSTSGFPAAFKQRGWNFAAQITAAGEVITLPVVVLITLLAQPRLQQALANDGLIPEIFGRLDANGNLKWSSILAGIPMTLLATFVPFAKLDDLISVGILAAFSMTNTALIVLKCGFSDTHSVHPPGDDTAPSKPVHSNGLLRWLGIYNACSFLAGLTCHLDSKLARSQFVQLSSFAFVIFMAFWIHSNFPVTGPFGGSQGSHPHSSNLHQNGHDFRQGGPTDPTFNAPMVPFIPCMGILANWVLIAQLEISGILLLVLYLGGVSILYIGYCRKLHPIPTWQTYLNTESATESRELDHYNSIASSQNSVNPPLLREFSMPKR